MIREIGIAPVLNGFVCRVGCQTVVFTSREALISHLDDYLKDPNAVEAKFSNGAVNSWLLKGPIAPQPMTAGQECCTDRNTLGSAR